MSAEMPKFYVTLSYLYGLFDYLSEKSLNQEQVLYALNMPRDLLDSPDTLLPVDYLDIGCNVATLVSGDPLAGFRAGQRMRPAHLGIVGHMMLCCRSIEELAQLGTRYGRLISNGADFEIRAKDGALSLYITAAQGRTTGHCRTAHDYSIGGWIAMSQWLGGSKLSPRYMKFPGEEVVSYDSIREELGCDIEFGGGATIIDLASGKHSFNMRSVDPGVRAMVEASLQQRLAMLDDHRTGQDETLATIVDLICARLPEGAPELDTIAAGINKTARQLRYALNTRNTTFKELVDSSRRSMAIKHMADPVLPLVDVALLLGFSDQTAFHRAFKRWFGKSPGDYRKELAQSRG